MKNEIILVGGGGHCKSCIEVIESSDEFLIKGIVDVPDKVGQSLLGYPILGTDDNLPDLVNEGFGFLITIGYFGTNQLREQRFSRINQLGGKWVTVIASTAQVSKHATIGEGTIIMHHAMINAGVSIGNNCIINSKALIEHDVHIEHHSHISTGGIINGDCRVGSSVFIGSNTTVINGIDIQSEVIVGAGSLVLKAIEEKGVYVGSPVKRVK